jgi:hypothetical protein
VHHPTGRNGLRAEPARRLDRPGLGAGDRVQHLASPPQPGRAGAGRGERGTDRAGFLAERGSPYLHLSDEAGTVGKRGLDVRAERGQRACHATADHQQPGRDHRGEAGDGLADRAAGRLDRAGRGGVAGGRRGGGLGGGTAAGGGGDRRAARVHLQAAVVTAAAARPAPAVGHVADLTEPVVRPDQQPATADQPAADPGAEGEEQRVGLAGGRAEGQLGEAERTGVVEDVDGYAGGAGQRLTEREAGPVAGKVGQESRHAGGPVGVPGYAETDRGRRMLGGDAGERGDDRVAVGWGGAATAADDPAAGEHHPGDGGPAEVDAERAGAPAHESPPFATVTSCLDSQDI